jgi:hypothetical protein
MKIKRFFEYIFYRLTLVKFNKKPKLNFLWQKTLAKRLQKYNDEFIRSLPIDFDNYKVLLKYFVGFEGIVSFKTFMNYEYVEPKPCEKPKETNENFDFSEEEWNDLLNEIG